MKTEKSHIGSLSPEMTLLGLLYRQAGYGYDLHRTVLNDLGQVWHLSQSQAYSILKRLEIQGDIISEVVPQEKLPSRQLLQMTGQGRQRFLAWLEAPSGGSIRAIRMGFLTRLYFLRMYMPERQVDAFERQRSEVRFHLGRLAQSRAELPFDQIYNRMSLDLRLRQLETVLTWLDECQRDFIRE